MEHHKRCIEGDTVQEHCKEKKKRETERERKKKKESARKKETHDVDRHLKEPEAVNQSRAEYLMPSPL